MKMTSGVGLSDLAFHRSKTLNFLSLPYTTPVMSGGVVEAGFFGGPLGTAFVALGISSCAAISFAAARAVLQNAMISKARSIHKHLMSCVLSIKCGCPGFEWNVSAMPTSRN